MKINYLILSVPFLFLSSCSDKMKSKNIIDNEDLTPDKIEVLASKQSQDAPIDTLKYNITKKNIGSGGYDLVNYFTDNSAELGLVDFSTKYNGVLYLFKNEDHKRLFVENPDKYLPAFGGWCSMTLAMGRATTPTYTNFLIINDKLHLFEKTLSINGKTLWQTNPKENEKLASNNYEEYKDKGTIQLPSN